MGWNIRCILFGHVWEKKGNKWVCRVCGQEQTPKK